MRHFIYKNIVLSPPQILTGLITNNSFIHGHRSGMMADTSRMCLSIIFTAKQSSKVQLWNPNLNFDCFPSLKFQFSSIAIFLDHCFKPVLYKMFVWTMRTIFGFRQKTLLLSKTLPKSEVLRKVHFSFYLEHEFIYGGKFLDRTPFGKAPAGAFVPEK